MLVENRADGASGLTSGQLDTESSTASGAWGQVISLHANGIDAPVAVRKAGNTTIAPYANWKGDYEVGTTADGTPTSSCTGTTSCPALDWPGGNENADGQKVLPAALDTWWGSLIAGKTDPSGMKYMRNRYYNPSNGQFTQQDPIGLAGGINLYGFASGDPVNFSEPFGLCPWCIGAAVGATAAAGYTLFENYLSDRPLTTNLVRNTVIGAIGGATLGAGLGTLAGAGAGAAASEATFFEGGRQALRTALGEGISGRSDAQAGNIARQLGKGAVDNIKLTTGSAGTITAEFTRAGRNGYQTLTKIINSAGETVRVVQTAYDKSGNLVHGESWK